MEVLQKWTYGSGRTLISIATFTDVGTACILTFGSTMAVMRIGGTFVNIITSIATKSICASSAFWTRITIALVYVNALIPIRNCSSSEIQVNDQWCS